jgi:hydroxymethylbilane synthase
VETRANTQTEHETGLSGKRRYTSLGVDLTCLPCLVVGAGRIGARKALTLLKGGARVTVVSPTLHPSLSERVSSGRIHWIPESYDEARLTAVTLVVAATNDPALNLRIANDARERGILCSVVSPGRFSQVIFPALHESQGVTVAVHTNGRDCKTARDVRDGIARSLDHRQRGQEDLLLFGLQPSRNGEYIGIRACNGALRDSAHRYALLDTCQRWECYAASSSPHAAAREIRRIIHSETGVLPESFPSSFNIRHGIAAFHHLLRVAVGLDSWLIGETDVVGQLRETTAQAADSPFLTELFQEVLTLQKRIRADSELAKLDTSWSEAILNAVRSVPGSLDGRVVHFAGCGRLFRAASTRLATEGARVIAFSHRAGDAAFDWSRDAGIEIRTMDSFQDRSTEGRFFILSAPLSGEFAEALSRRPEIQLIVDLSGENAATLGSHAAYRSLRQIACHSLDAELAARLAAAERLAIEHALAWHVRRHPPTFAAQLKIGARSSALSQTQVKEVHRYLKLLAPHAHFEFLPIDSPGDRDKKTPLPSVDNEDFFTRDLDEALRRGEIDIAVHSAKDLPSQVPAGISIAAFTPSLAPWECLITRDGSSLTELPSGARVGTSSERRADWLSKRRPDLVPSEIRGNVPDRLRQLDEGEYDALILASVGLIRLGLQDRITHILDEIEFPPEPGQGSLALLIRKEDARIAELLAPLDLGDKEGIPWA